LVDKIKKKEKGTRKKEKKKKKLTGVLETINASPIMTIQKI
jgi:hypothetical protein